MTSKVASNGTNPKASRARQGNAFMARSTLRPPRSSSSSNSQAVSLTIPGVTQPGGPCVCHFFGWSKWVQDHFKSGGYGIERLELRHKVEGEMRFNRVVHDPDALFNIIDQQRRDQAVIEANDTVRR